MAASARASKVKGYLEEKYKRMRRDGQAKQQRLAEFGGARADRGATGGGLEGLGLAYHPDGKGGSGAQMAYHGGTVDPGSEGGAEAPFHAHVGECRDSSGGAAQARSTWDRAGRGKCGGERSREGEALPPQPQQGIRLPARTRPVRGLRA